MSFNKHRRGTKFLKPLSLCLMLLGCIIIIISGIIILLPRVTEAAGDPVGNGSATMITGQGNGMMQIKIGANSWLAYMPLTPQMHNTSHLRLTNLPQIGESIGTFSPNPQATGPVPDHVPASSANLWQQGMNGSSGLSAYLISKQSSGLVSHDPLTNETMTEKQLQASQEFWTFGGDAPAENASYSFWRDSGGLHMGVQPPSSTKGLPVYAGYFAETPATNASLFHATITAPTRYLQNASSYFQSGLDVAASFGQSSNYVSCFSDTGQSGTIWAVALGGMTYQILWADSSPDQPLTRECTIITNGQNLLKVYVDRTMVFASDSMALQMAGPFNVDLESESSYSHQMLNATFTDYYATSNETVMVTGKSTDASAASISNLPDKTALDSPLVSGSANFDVAKFHFPLNGTLTFHDYSNATLASTSEEIYGGDLYTLFTVPGAPQNLKATQVSSTGVFLSWNPPATNGGSSITAYELGRSKGGLPFGQIINSTNTVFFPVSNETFFNDTGLEGNTTYTYEVFARNLAGFGPPSGMVNETTDNGSQSPTGLTATAVSPTEIELAWLAPASGNIGVLGYGIDRSDDGGDTWSTIVYDTESANTEFSDTGLAADTSYTYRVSTITSNSVTLPSNEADATTSVSTQGYPASATGVLEPLYCMPYGNDPSHCQVNSTVTGCSQYPDDFCWQPLVDAHFLHPRVPIFAVVNPNNGPCRTTDNPCDYNADIGNGIGNLTKDGITVLGYVRTRYADPNSTLTCCPYAEVQQNITQWASLYQQKGVKGVKLDEMSNDPGRGDGTLEYYQNLTRYAHNTLGFAYVFGNPGQPTVPAYFNGNASDTFDIYEGSGEPSNYQLAEGTFVGTSPVFDRSRFSFVSYCQPTLPDPTLIGNESDYVGYLYYTDVGGSCTPSDQDPYDRISSYLSGLVAELDKPAATITIDTVDSSGRPMTGYYIEVSQGGNVVPSGYSPLPYLGTSGIQYTFTPIGYDRCSFDHWNDDLSSAASRTVLASSTDLQFTAVFSGPGCP